MAGSHPFEAVLVGGLALRGKARITVSQRLQLPVGFAFVVPENLRCHGGIESMGKSGQRFEIERYERGGVADETGDCFGNDTTLLCKCAPFHKHLQV